MSLGIYGEVVSDHNSPPTPLPHVENTAVSTPSYLPPSLDAVNHADPTSIANQLLAVLPDSPPLHLIIQLVFCLKPEAEDWDRPDFPYLYSDLTRPVDEADLGLAISEIMRPVDVSVPTETLQSFASQVAELLRSKVWQNTRWCDLFT